MRRFFFLVFIGVFLTRNVAPSTLRKHPALLESLFVGLPKSNDTEKKDLPNICETDECKKIAKIIAGNIDKSVDPCNNFYEYACGKWPEQNPIPEGYDSWSSYDVIQKKVFDRVQAILDAGLQDNDVLAVRIAKNWYTACTDTDAMEEQGLEPIIYTLARIGGWPIIMDPDEWDEQEYNWQKVDDQYMRLTGKNTFHDVRVHSRYYSEDNVVNETKQVVIDIPHLPPETFMLWAIIQYNYEDEDLSDEDTSDENEQSKEDDEEEQPGSEGSENEEDDNKEAKKEIDKKKIYGRISGKKNRKVEHDEKRKTNSQVSTKQELGSEEPGSEGSENRFDNNDDNNDAFSDDDDDDDDDNDSDNNDDDDNDDDEDESDEYDDKVKNDANSNKKIVTRKNKIVIKKNRKLQYIKKNKYNARVSTKHGSHKTKEQRIKREVNMMRMFAKLAQNNYRDVLRARQNKRKHMNKERREMTSDEETSDIQTNETISSPPFLPPIEETDLEWRKKYATYISKIARALAKARRTGVPEDHIDKDIEDIIDFQVKLFELTSEGGKDIEMTLDNFQDWYDEKNPKTNHSKIDWVYKVTHLFDEASVNVDGDLDIELKSQNYFKGLISLLDETPSRVIVNYIHWNFVSQAIKSMTKEMRDLYNNVWDDEEIEDSDKEIKTRCQEKFEMMTILAYEYVRKHFPDNITQTARDMIDDIQKEVEYQVKESDWLDESTKDFILAKLVNMKKYIGYPDWYKNDTIVKRYYQGLIIGDSYYENILSYGRYKKWKDLRFLTKEKEDDDGTWWLSPLVVNAFFSPYENSITLLAAYFQNPFFAYNRPQAINYGIIGATMGHEVNHAFDNSGHLFDKNGKYVDWLPPMADAYGKRAECFVNQFNKYMDKEEGKIDNYGNQTAGENIADTMGLEAAYRAYLRRERECKTPDVALPGLEDITNNQLFFLAYANNECTAYKNPMVTAAFDSHSIGRLRVIGSVSNSDDFAKAFNCPVGSPMNPVKKCNIWK